MSALDLHDTFKNIVRVAEQSGYSEAADLLTNWASSNGYVLIAVPVSPSGTSPSAELEVGREPQLLATLFQRIELPLERHEEECPETSYPSQSSSRELSRPAATRRGLLWRLRTCLEILLLGSTRAVEPKSYTDPEHPDEKPTANS